MLESKAITNLFRVSSIDFVNTCQREILFSFLWRTHMALNDVASLQGILLYLLESQEYVVRRREVIEIT